MKKKVNLPKKDAGRRLAARLKDLGKQPPPKNIVNKINSGDTELFEISLIFDNLSSAHAFAAYWLDGGGQPDSIDWDTCYEESDRKNWGIGTGCPTFLRIKGSGDDREGY